MRTIAVVNNKGGVGKTTTVLNLGAALARKGRRTLVVDLDGQASLSLALGLARAELSPSSAEVLIEALPAAAAIRATAEPNLDLLPASMEIASSDLLLASAPGRERRLRRALEPLGSRYDRVLLDCPPSMSLVTVNALVAADALLVPLCPHYMALEGFQSLRESIALARAHLGARAPLLGVVLTMADARTKVCREVRALLRGALGDGVLRTEIRPNVRLQEAPSHGTHIFRYDPRSSGARAYRNLAAEVERRLARMTEETANGTTGKTGGALPTDFVRAAEPHPPGDGARGAVRAR